MHINDQLKKTFFIAIGIVTALALLLIAENVFLHPSSYNPVLTADNQDITGVVEGVAGMKIGGSFTLTHHSGQIVTENDYRDKARLIFFGFTYCPDICPTELGTLARLRQNLTIEQRDKLNILFVSVDPERDTPEQMKNYIALFDENIHGLTGTKEQTKQITDAYKVYNQKIPLDQNDPSSYTIDHSSFIYFFDDQNVLQALFRAGTDENVIKQKIAPFL